MCEASAYIMQNGQEVLLLETIDLMEVEGDQVHLKSLFGEEKKIKAKVVSLSLVEHKIILQPL